ncbi:MAG: CopG family transcriptional regulator [Elusimicrobia bacterium]|nr:CopG family transcriptional regulator [Elusimicrobiota bacterium]
MRTTVTLAKDVASAVRRLQRERGVGVSEAVNRLARAGLSLKPTRERFRQRSAKIGLRIEVANVAEALEVLEGPTAR